MVSIVRDPKLQMLTVQEMFRDPFRWYTQGLPDVKFDTLYSDYSKKLYDLTKYPCVKELAPMLFSHLPVSSVEMTDKRVAVIELFSLLYKYVLYFPNTMEFLEIVTSCVIVWLHLHDKNNIRVAVKHALIEFGGPEDLHAISNDVDVKNIKSRLHLEKTLSDKIIDLFDSYFAVFLYSQAITTTQRVQHTCAGINKIAHNVSEAFDLMQRHWKICHNNVYAEECAKLVFKDGELSPDFHL